MVVIKQNNFKYLPNNPNGCGGSYDIKILPPTSEEIKSVAGKFTHYVLVKMRIEDAIENKKEILSILSSEKKVCELPEKLMDTTYKGSHPNIMGDLDKAIVLKIDQIIDYLKEKEGIMKYLLLILLLLPACSCKPHNIDESYIKVNLDKSLLPARIFCNDNRVIIVDADGRVWND